MLNLVNIDHKEEQGEWRQIFMFFLCATVLHVCSKLLKWDTLKSTLSIELSRFKKHYLNVFLTDLKMWSKPMSPSILWGRLDEKSIKLNGVNSISLNIKLHDSLKQWMYWSLFHAFSVAIFDTWSLEQYFWLAFKTFVFVLSNVRSLLLLDFQLSVVPGYV